MQVPISQIEPLFALDAVRVDGYIANVERWQNAATDLAPRVAHPFRWRLCDGSHRRENSHACRAENDLAPHPGLIGD